MMAPSYHPPPDLRASSLFKWHADFFHHIFFIWVGGVCHFWNSSSRFIVLQWYGTDGGRMVQFGYRRMGWWNRRYARHSQSVRFGTTQVIDQSKKPKLKIIPEIAQHVLVVINRDLGLLICKPTVTPLSMPWNCSVWPTTTRSVQSTEPYPTSGPTPWTMDSSR